MADVRWKRWWLVAGAGVMVGVAGMVGAMGADSGSAEATGATEAVGAVTTRGTTTAAAATGVSGEERRVEYPLFGVSVVPPLHWAAVEDVATGTVQRWEFKERGSAEPRCVISLEVKPAEKDSVDDQVQKYLKQFGGKVMDKPPALGGEAAQGVVAELEQGGRMKFLFAQRDDRIYMLNASSVDEVFPEAAFREVARSVEWTRPVAPAQDPLDDEARTLLGRVSVRLPEGMRPIGPAPGAAVTWKPTARWRLFNYRLGVTELMLTVTGEEGNGAEARTTVEQRGRDVGAQGELKWTAVPGDGTAERMMSQLVPTRGHPPDVPPALRRWAVVTTAKDGKTTVLEFAVAPKDQGDLAAYEEMTASVVRTAGGK